MIEKLEQKEHRFSGDPATQQNGFDLNAYMQNGP
jgi:hypothetical protein